MNLPNRIKDYFDLNRRERNAMAVLLVLIIVLFAAQYFTHYFLPQPKADFSAIRSQALRYEQAALQEDSNTETDLPEEKAEAAAQAEYFFFDPNTATEVQLTKLGINVKAVQNLLKYRSKGGRFYKPEDLRKIYGLDAAVYENIKGYIRIQPPKLSVIELNRADSAALIDVRGIGPVTASRILAYRKRLGGFASKEQLMEIQGLGKSRYEKIEAPLSVDTLKVHKLNINLLDARQLSRHPYVGDKLAEAIVLYRDQHGLFKEPDDLLKIEGIDKQAFERLRPYLSTR